MEPNGKAAVRRTISNRTVFVPIDGENHQLLSTVREITVQCPLAPRGRGQGEAAESASVISRTVLIFGDGLGLFPVANGLGIGSNAVQRFRGGVRGCGDAVRSRCCGNTNPLPFPRRRRCDVANDRLPNSSSVRRGSVQWNRTIFCCAISQEGVVPCDSRIDWPHRPELA